MNTNILRKKLLTLTNPVKVNTTYIDGRRVIQLNSYRGDERKIPLDYLTTNTQINI